MIHATTQVVVRIIAEAKATAEQKALADLFQEKGKEIIVLGCFKEQLVNSFDQRGHVDAEVAAINSIVKLGLQGPRDPALVVVMEMQERITKHLDSNLGENHKLFAAIANALVELSLEGRQDS